MKRVKMGLRDHSAIKSICCSWRRCRFDSKHSQSRSQPLLTPVPGHPMPSSGLCRYQTCMWYTHIHVGKTHLHVNLKFKKFKWRCPVTETMPLRTSIDYQRKVWITSFSVLVSWILQTLPKYYRLLSLVFITLQKFVVKPCWWRQHIFDSKDLE